MSNPSNIEQIVMRRVHRIRMLRLFINNITASAFVLVLALYAIGREVWVAKVLTNGPGDLLGRIVYLGYAFLQTQLAVQVLALLVVGASIYLARELSRAISALRLVYLA